MESEIEYKGYIIKIMQDYDSESPRECDNLGTMVCWHRRMNLGDEQPKGSPTDFMLHELIYNFEDKIPYPEDSYCEDWLLEDEKRIFEYFYKFHVVVPICAYEHGGITISSGYRAGWDSFDSGQLGFIYVSKEKALKELAQKRWSKKFEEKIVSYLNGEIETYDQYLNNDVYGYIIEKDEDELDSCWGFYGEEYCLEEAKSVVDYYVRELNNQKRIEKKNILNLSVPSFFGL